MLRQEDIKYLIEFQVFLPPYQAWKDVLSLEKRQQCDMAFLLEVSAGKGDASYDKGHKAAWKDHIIY